MSLLRADVLAKRLALEDEADIVMTAYQRAVQADDTKAKLILRGHWCYLMGQINGLGTALGTILNS